MNKKIIFFSLILLTLNISAQCSENQINLNTASAEELDQLSGVGPAIAQNIINSRPFNSVDDLINVSRIGPVTLEKIKSQGLACIDEESKKEEEKVTINKETIIEEETIEQSKKEIQIIDLTGNSIENASQKDIKITNVKKSLDKKAIYGLAGFCILLGILFLIKNQKRKNEFR
jgi:competence ComEA-like helix-hairpin-helix protein